MASDGTGELIDLRAARLRRLEAARIRALERLDCQAAVDATIAKVRLLGYLADDDDDDDEDDEPLPPAA